MEGAGAVFQTEFYVTFSQLSTLPPKEFLTTFLSTKMFPFTDARDNGDVRFFIIKLESFTSDGFFIMTGLHITLVFTSLA